MPTASVGMAPARGHGTRAGFYVAVTKYFEERAVRLHEEKPISPLGDLEHLVVQGDTATGRAQSTTTRTESKYPQKFEKTFKFRRINGGWLLDSL